MNHSDVVAAIDLLGDQILNLDSAAQELPSADFINQALYVMRDVVPHHAGWWGIGVDHGEGQIPVAHREEVIGLPSTYPSEWRKYVQDNPFFQNVRNRVGHVQRHSFSDSYEREDPSAALTALRCRYDLRHVMSIGLCEPFTGLSFFVTVYRSNVAFSDVEAALFGQLICHTLQLWRHKLQDELSISATHDMFHAALVRTDGRVLSIGMHLCEAIYSEWPEWDGMQLPEQWVMNFDNLPRQVRLGSAMVDMTERAGHVYLQLVAFNHALRLSPREQRVAYLYAAGISCKEIASQVGLTPATVRTYLQRAYLQLGVRNKIQLVKALAMD